MNDKTPRRTLTVAIDHRFYDYGNQGIFTDLAFGYPYWADYLTRYAHCTVVARMLPATGSPDASFVRADGPNVTFVAVPNFVGPIQYAMGLFRTLRISYRAAREADVSIIRNGGVATTYWACLLLLGRSYGKEVQGEFLASALIWSRHQPRISRLASSAAAKIADRATKAQARGAAAVAYVSPHLRKHYPARTRSREFVYSSVRIDNALQAPLRTELHFDKVSPVKLITVGRLEPEKGHDILLSALRGVRFSWTLDILGSGSQLENLKRVAREGDISQRVRFRGSVPPGDSVLRSFASCDLFILPSRTEGMPRALLEAMAAGIPAIGSRVGGVPLLLPPEQTFRANDSEELGRVLTHIVRHSSPRVLSLAGREVASAQYGISTMSKTKERYHRCLMGE